MPRRPLEKSNCLPYHVTAHREEFHLDRPTLWDILGSECLTMSLIFGVEFHSLVLMPNHFHMILTVPEQDLGIVMNIFMSNVTRRSNRATGRSGHVFGGPYHWSIIKSNRYFGHALKYVYRNPTRARLCENVEEYPFSTLPGLMGNAHLPFPIHFTRTLFEAGLPMEEASIFLEWLNQPLPLEAEKLIKIGLDRKVFENIVRRKGRRSDLLANLL